MGKLVGVGKTHTRVVSEVSKVEAKQKRALFCYHLRRLVIYIDEALDISYLHHVPLLLPPISPFPLQIPQSKSYPIKAQL